MLDTLRWLIVLEVIGLVALPISFAFFRWLPDRGYAFSKLLGLVLLVYALWMGGYVHLFQNTFLTLVVLLALLSLLSLWLLKRKGREMRAYLRDHKALIIATELVFLLAFLGWTWFRVYTPDISHTEQPMDMAMMNTSRVSANFPPSDPWLSGSSVNYYYFGYLQHASVAKLSGTPPYVGFNLALSTVGALAAVAAFGLAANLVLLARKPGSRWRTESAIGVGILAALLLTAMGNLEVVAETAYANGWTTPGFLDWLGIKDIQGTPSATSWRPTNFNWWWHGTRLIDTLKPVTLESTDYTITEFPVFSLMLGDLHPHVMSFPFMLMAAGVACNQFLSPEPLSWSWLRRRWPWALLTSLVIGGLWFFNSWDFPTFAVLFGGLAVVQACRLSGGDWRQALRGAVPIVSVLVALFLTALWIRGLKYTDSSVTILGTFLIVVAVWGAVALMLWAYHRSKGSWRAGIEGVPSTLLVLLVLAVVLYLPFYIAQATQGSQVGGIFTWRGPNTRPIHYFLYWGPLLLIAVGLVVSLVWGVLRRAKQARQPPEQPKPSMLSVSAAKGAGLQISLRWPTFRGNAWLAAIGLTLLPLALWLVYMPIETFFFSKLGRFGTEVLPASHHHLDLGLVSSKIANLWPLLIVLVLGFYALLRRARETEESQRGPYLALAIAVLALYITEWTELFFIKDIFGTRMNTMFKFYYQGWALLSVAGAFGLYWLGSAWANARTLGRIVSGMWIGLVLLTLVGGFSYTLLSTKNWVGAFNKERSLNGLHYVERQDPGEFAAVQWLIDHGKPSDVIAEAVCPAQVRASNGGYACGGYYIPARVGRISSSTGIPTIIGWGGHEYQWRGVDVTTEATKRVADVESIYTDPDLDKVRSLLRQYEVTYIYVGGLERQWFSIAGESRFEALGQKVYSSQGVNIYQAPKG